MNKKKNARRKTPYPGLTHSVNPKPRWELIDHDYLDKLTPEEKQFLSNFNEEYLSGNYNHEGARIHKKKAHRNDAYTRNNKRNIDTFALFRTSGWIPEAGLDSAFNNYRSTDLGQTEDSIIEAIDHGPAMKRAEARRLQRQRQRERAKKKKSAKLRKSSRARKQSPKT